MAGFATVAQVAEGLGFNTAAVAVGTSKHDAVTDCIDAASSIVRDFCGRDFEINDAVAVRSFAPLSAGLLPIDPVADTSSLVIGSLVFGTDYFGRVKGGVVTQLRLADGSWADYAASSGRVAVTAKWGVSDVPGAVRRATIMLAKRIYYRSATEAGVMGMISGGDGMFYLRSTDPDVAALLTPFMRSRVNLNVITL